MNHADAQGLKLGDTVKILAVDSVYENIREHYGTIKDISDNVGHQGPCTYKEMFQIEIVGMTNWPLHYSEIEKHPGIGIGAPVNWIISNEIVTGGTVINIRDVGEDRQLLYTVKYDKAPRGTFSDFFYAYESELVRK